MVQTRSSLKFPFAQALAGAAWATLLGAMVTLFFAGDSLLVAGLMGTLMALAMAGFIAAMSVGLFRGEPAEARMETTPFATANARVPGRLMSEVFGRNVDIFRGLTVQQVSAVVALGSVLRPALGEVLGKEREPGQNIYVILSGKAQLTARTSMGHMTIRIAEQGESLPLAALLGDGRLITTITAMSEMEVLAFPTVSLIALCRERPDIGSSLYANVAEILAGRYKATLNHFTATTQMATSAVDLWANV